MTRYIHGPELVRLSPGREESREEKFKQIYNNNKKSKYFSSAVSGSAWIAPQSSSRVSNQRTSGEFPSTKKRVCHLDATDVLTTREIKHSLNVLTNTT